VLKDIGPRTTYGAIFLFLAMIVGISLYRDLLSVKDVVASLLALFGTFLGAILAFRLNEDKERRKELKANVKALNKALFVLGRQANALRTISSNIAGYKSEFERALNLPAFNPPSYGDLSQDIEGLSFLLESEDPTILLELTVEQERFEQVIESLRMRTNLHLYELQPEVARLNLNGRNMTEIEAAAELGERLYGAAVQAANNIYEHAEATEKSLPEMQEKLRRVAQKLFPDAQFIKYV